MSLFDSRHWHVYPEGDLIEHDTENQDQCVCGPTSELIQHEDGDRWLHTHHSLDGRENNE
ncbi:hypothetical protein [Glutamicibacter halophytocola]|uniref:Uncharacterized protein n=1 Tax=Glutamicibacter halophytocola TaxID=1933880 RepID=A0AA94XY91_9MICC|nr:hypothetical protein [Glutamicibacter halophytocola]UUX60151.1 hypothetical protein NUH22_05945 [Glutamicibacter halophytocola]